MGAVKAIAPGTVFGGDYEIERQLAVGGMGAVYVARQRSTQKLRALKTLLPEYVADPVMRSRFAREAIVGGQIESDHVVDVLAAGIDEPTGLPWLVMELLVGDDLASTVKKRGTLAPADVVEVVRQLGHALAAAHRAGVVHRDLKPENIFLATARRDGVAFMVKVLDFGIARLLYTVRTSHTTSAMGSPLWMAPEQTDAALPITPATDVWALGLIVFWMLTGRYFWLTPTQPDATIGAMIRELLMEALPSASQRAAQLGVAAQLPSGFDAWFARCVVREPEARFRDAGEAVAPLLAMLAAPGASAAAMGGQNMSHPAASPLPPTGASHLGPTQLPLMPATLAVPPASLLAKASPAAPQSSAAPRSKMGLVIAAAIATAAAGGVAVWAFTRPHDDAGSQMETQVGAALDAAVATAMPGAPAAPLPPSADATMQAPQSGSTQRTVVSQGREVLGGGLPPPIDAPSVPVEPPPTSVEPLPDRPAAPPDLGAPAVDQPAAPPDLGAPVIDRPATPIEPVQAPPPPPSPPPPQPEPVVSGDPCTRNSNCSSCVAADGCGWCNNVNRCLSGSWASGPTSRACARGPEWVSEADHCEDRCARASNCSSCVGIEGCGWCNAANRCVAGSWARGPYMGACSTGPDWVHEADHCDDRCGRASNCAACVGIEGCGWCANVNRCLAGSWARGAYTGACARGPQWATEADQCR